MLKLRFLFVYLSSIAFAISPHVKFAIQFTVARYVNVAIKETHKYIDCDVSTFSTQINEQVKESKETILKNENEPTKK